MIDGKGEWAVVEACEAYDSFHDFDPTIVVLTNLEMDHADFHGTWEDLRDSVLRFVKRLPEDGVLVYCKEDEGSSEIAESFDGETRGYDRQMALNIGHPEVHKERLKEIPGTEKHQASSGRGYVTRTMPLLLFGEHNWTNASGALRAIIEATRMSGEEEALGTVSAVQAAVITFRGADRRLQSFAFGEIDIVDDYAHHPTEIRATIQALREKYPDRRLVVVYQPHLYSRTNDLIPEFAEALDLADHVFLTDIYPAREDPIPGISSLRVAELMTSPVTYVPSRHLLPRKVNDFAQPGDVVVGMGAGNISDFAPAMIKEMERPEKPRIAVVYGGDSAEREVSILSGREVHAALTELGYEASLLDATELLLSGGDLSDLQGDARPDLAFLCVHGTNAEDGAIQGLFELLHIPYTGSGILASAIVMDKSLTKTILQRRGIAVPPGVLIESESERPEKMPPPPVIVKPNAQGSTIGLSFVERQDQLDDAIKLAFRYDDKVLVEEWIKGVEIAVPVAGDTALPVVEIVPASGRYDFESKYTPGATEEICPAMITDEQTAEAQRLALECHSALGCKGVTRTDMIVAKDGIVVLEVNTLPGFTATSLVPRSAVEHGWSFQDLVRWMVRDAIKIEEAPRSR